MDDISSRVIENTTSIQETAAPDARGSQCLVSVMTPAEESSPECADGIAESDPQRHKYHPGHKIHTTKQSTSQDDDSDSSEDKLEVDHGRRVEVGVEICRDQVTLSQVVLHRENRTDFFELDAS